MLLASDHIEKYVIVLYYPASSYANFSIKSKLLQLPVL